jgi:hypothetical protein
LSLDCLPVDKIDAPKNSQDQNREGDQQPSELPIRSDEVHPQAMSDPEPHC